MINTTTCTTDVAAYVAPRTHRLRVIQSPRTTANYSNPDGKHVAILGRSNIVGRPLANLLSMKSIGGNATVSLCHSRTTNLKKITINADIVIAAIGIPNFVTEDMVKENVVVIDVGINRVKSSMTKRGYRLVGDVEFESVKLKSKAITPVPGGVGPMTIAMLLRNTLQAAKLRCG